MAKDESLKGIIALIGFGSAIYFSGLYRFKLRRRIADTPLSKIGSAAIGGPIDIAGKIFCYRSDLITSPLTSEVVPCFIWTIEELKASGKDSYWEEIGKYSSLPYIYLEDDSEGLAAIDVGSIEFLDTEERCSKFEFSSSDITLPESAVILLKEKNLLQLHSQNLSNRTRKFRITETRFKAGETIFIHGHSFAPPFAEIAIESSIKTGERSDFFKEKIAGLVKEAESDPNAIANYDYNKNKTLDSFESAYFAQDLEKKLTESRPEFASEYLNRVKVFIHKDLDGEVGIDIDRVYVSSKKEEDLDKSLLTQASKSLILGPCMIALGVVYLLYKVYFEKRF